MGREATENGRRPSQHGHEHALTHSYITEGAFDSIAVTAGIIQTAVYADFGYIVSGKKLEAECEAEREHGRRDAAAQEETATWGSEGSSMGE